MIKRNIVRAILASTALAGGCLAAPAWAQSPHPNRDGNGVDLTTGEFNLRLPIASIGSGQAALSLVAYDGATDNWTQAYLTKTVVGSTTTIDVFLGDTSDRFVLSGSATSAASSRGTGAVFSTSGDTYRSLSGVVITFVGNTTAGQKTNLCDAAVLTGCTMLADTMSGKSGLTVTFGWDIHANCGTTVDPIDGTVDCTDTWRLGSVSNAAGYAISWAFATDSVGFHSNPAPDWFRRTSAQLTNANVSSSSWPTVTYANPSSNVTTIATPASETWRITTTSGLVTGVRRPTASSDTTTISYSSGKVSSVTNNGITTGYAYSVSGSTATMVVTDALSNATTIVSDLTKYRPTSITNAVPKTTSMTYDSAGRPTEVTASETNKVQYGYDGNGNLTTTTIKAKSSSSLADIVTTAQYDTTCTSVVTCNTLTWSKDALGNQTDYAYDGTTGLLTTVTAPAATSGAKRAQTRYSYSTVAGVSMVTGVSSCATGATSDTPSCVGTADESKRTIGYDSNLNVTSVSKGAGDASLTATTAATYDAIGNLVTVDGPLSGTADTVMYRYDADRRRIGVIAPDPDASGSLKRRAVRTTYNADGQATVNEIGTVDSTSDSDWSAFTSLQQVTATYDANAYKTRDVSTASSTTYGVTDYSYDTVGRPDCVAARLNPSQWGTATAACTAQTAGSDGADRIAKNNYDVVGRVTKVQSAYAITGVQSDEVTATYTDNGQIATATDAEGNKTSYTYDGVDRLSKTTFPSTTKGAGTSNTGDYELLTYDAASNVTNRQLRDGTSIGYTYDARNRAITKNLPGSELDVTYTYDLLSRPLTIATSAQTVTLGYDALGRNTSQANPIGTVSYQYDLAGRRTRLTWPDTFYVTYDYDAAGNLSAIKESGSTSLATFDYDSLGRRTTLTRGNGVPTTYSYDNVSRLTSLYSNPTGTSYDLTLGMSYNNAGQIKSTTRSNDTYSWTGAANVTRAYTANGLNQFTASGAVSLGYDARGNLTSSGSDSYTYSSENLLLTGPSSASLSYDPLKRLYEVSNSTTSVSRFLYDGTQLIGSLNSAGTYVRRFVTVPGSDELIAEYKPMSGTVYWKLTDERGSVITTVDSSGNASNPNTYDEYGIPGSGNAGRYQYTGQVWLPEVGLYYYKARMYSPTLGRFMQTDPIGYRNGSNWHNYVKSDPINLRDPSGLYSCENDFGRITIVPGQSYTDGDDIVVVGAVCGASISTVSVGSVEGTFNPREVSANGGSGDDDPTVLTFPIVPDPAPLTPDPPSKLCQNAETLELAGASGTLLGLGIAGVGLFTGPGEVIAGPVGIGLATVSSGVAALGFLLGKIGQCK